MTESRVDLPTEDGVIDCYTFQPDGSGPWPSVIVYMDAFGIRPQLAEMAQRLASHGYFVAVPNLYYRAGSFPPFDRQQVTVEGPERDRFRRMIASITNSMVMRDTAAVIELLDGRRETTATRIGCVGYCMGGGFALSALGTFPDRVVAAASFHGASLATDKPDSPHRLADKMRGKLYVGVAEIDPGFPRDQQERLERALTDAGVDYTLEVYQNARHGFAVTGHLVYDREASERHWAKLVELFGQTLST